MKDKRLLIPFDQQYIAAIGCAAAAFARLEWNAVYCGQRLQAGYIDTVDRKTAGVIAKDLVAFALAISDSSLRALVLPAAEEFKRLVVVRNAILHGKPCTAPNGDQRISNGDGFWEPEDLADAADAFTECSETLNAFLYDQLKLP